MGASHSINLDILEYEEYVAYQEAIHSNLEPIDSEEEWENPDLDPSFLDPVVPRRSLPPRSVVKPLSHITSHQVGEHSNTIDLPSNVSIEDSNPNNSNLIVQCNESIPAVLLDDISVEGAQNRSKVDNEDVPSTSRYLPRSLSLTLGNEKLHLDFVEKLGEGGYGSVSRAIDNRGVSFAIKSLYCLDQSTYDDIVFSEVALLFELDHPNIVKMYGFDIVHSTAIIVMEYCGEGTLNSRLDLPVDFKIQLQWMEQSASALMYLHEQNIVHRDLKTDNVLISKNNVKIADFGLARHFVCCAEGTLFNNNDYLTHNSRYMQTLAGTPFWLAPEVFDQRYNEKADVFSLGTIFYAICERKFCTYNGEKYYAAFVMHKGEENGIGFVMYERQEWIQPVFSNIQSIKLKQIICDMLHFDPSTRASLVSVRDVVNDVFVTTLL